MHRYVTFILIFNLLSGCSVTQPIIFDQSALTVSPATVSGSCSSECKKAISEKFQERIGPYGAFTGPATLVRLGSWTGYEYNYKFILKSGKYDAELMVNNYMALNPAPTTLPIELEPSHDYFFGQIIKSTYMSEGRDYKWHPVLFDNTLNKIIYPAGEFVWLGNMQKEQ